MAQIDQGVMVSPHRYQAIPRVLIFVRNGRDILLLKGAPTKRIWANLYNGVGGHVEADEDILTAARRELTEETGLVVNDLRLEALVNVDAGTPGVGILLYVFTGWTAERQTIPSVEGSLHWTPIAQLDQLDLVEDLRWLLPQIINRAESAPPLFLHYSYDEQGKLIIRQSLSPAQ
jgi:8-oxo-dGTP diphosphatase